MVGAGIYMSDSSDKADEYACETDGVCTMLVLRCVLGKPYITSERKPKITGCPDGFDSVLADRETPYDTFKEFVAYSVDQVYPAFIVQYKREF